MPAKPGGRRRSAAILQPALALTACLAVLAATAAATADDARSEPRRRHNDRAPHGVIGGPVEARAGEYQLISTSSDDKTTQGPPPPVASGDLPAAEKQYDYPLVRPVYAPFVTRPSLPSYAMPYVEILDHHRDPPFHNPQHYMGSPLVSTVVVQDLSQTPPRPPEHEDVFSTVDNFHHLGPTKIPFTNIQVVSKPIGSADTKHDTHNPNFTDKVQETSLEDSEPLLENPPNLDLSGVVEEVVRKVFSDNPSILKDASKMVPKPAPGMKPPWACPPVTCCSKATRNNPRRCSTFVNCVLGRPPGCPLREDRVPESLAESLAEALPQALALSKPSNGFTNTTDPEPGVRDGEPRFKKKKKKISKKKKKLLKKLLLPLLIAYKLLFLLILPLLLNGMMMMMSSSGMAGFFFALIGASITMVRVYSGGVRAPPYHVPPPSKVVKVIKYVEKATTLAPSPTPAPTPVPTMIHHQPYMEDHYPTYHAPPHPPSYGSYYPHPYWTRNYERSTGLLDGGRKKRRRLDNGHLDETNLNGVWLNTGDNQFWIV